MMTNAKNAERFGLPEKVIWKMQQVFAAYPGIQKVVLYGLRAKGKYRKVSDIDPTLKGSRLTLNILLAVERQLDDFLLPWQIDNDALRDHINHHGIAFYVAHE